jgi:hypothetical protein
MLFNFIQATVVKSKPVFGYKERKNLKNSPKQRFLKLSFSGNNLINLRVKDPKLISPTS